MISKLSRRKRRIEIPSFTKSILLENELPSHVHDIIQLIQLSQEDIAALQLIDDIMAEHAPHIAERHYNMIMDMPEIKKIFDPFTSDNRYVPAITNYYKQ